MISDIPVSPLPLALLIPSPDAIACLQESTARRLQLVPLTRRVEAGLDSLMIACADPADPVVAERLERLLPRGLKATLVAAHAADIRIAIDKCYSSALCTEELTRLCQRPESAMTLIQEQPNTIVQLLEYLLLQGRRQRASDIHLSPGKLNLQVRFRVDGVLRHFLTVSMAVHNGLLVRIKILAAVDIAETRRPQDGQFSQYIDGSSIDFRVSCFPTVDGQNTVIRLLDTQYQYDTLDRLQLPSQLRECLAELAQCPDGLLVVCGPTGSGKSNTLHALINERDAVSLNIMTLEDPVELNMPGIRQSSIDAEHAMDFTQGVRGLLRQDPDVLLIGEVRDTTSCAMALRAAMSGHQVLTTVHASSALAGLARLRELGALAGQLAENLVGVASQRLVRRRCQQCAGGVPDCSQCKGSAYQGRQLLMELLLITPAIASLIASEAPRHQLLLCAQQEGFLSLRQQGMQLVEQAITTESELDRVLGRENRDDRHDVLHGGRENAVD